MLRIHAFFRKRLYTWPRTLPEIRLLLAVCRVAVQIRRVVNKTVLPLTVESGNHTICRFGLRLSGMAGKADKRLLKQVLWFERRVRFDIDYFDLLQPHREVTQHRRYKSGTFRSVKSGRDIQYESGLEYGFAQRLEADSQVVFYWDQPVQIPYWRGRKKGHYTPDYGIYLNTGHVVLAEVKELTDMLDYRVQQKAEALMTFCSERGFGMLLTDGRHTPKDLMKGKINRKLERQLLSALDRHPLRQTECQQIMERCNATAAELHKAVIRHELRFRPFPLKIRRGNDNRIFKQVFFERKNYEDAALAQFETLFGRSESGNK